MMIKLRKTKKLANKLFELDSEDAIFDLLIVDEAPYEKRNNSNQHVRKINEKCLRTLCVFINNSNTFIRIYYLNCHY